MLRYTTLRPRPTRAILYITGVVILALFLMAFIWFTLWALMVQIESGISSSMAQYDTTNSTHYAFEYAYTFMVNLWRYLLVIFILGLLYWVWIYSQRKNIGGMYG